MKKISILVSFLLICIATISVFIKISFFPTLHQRLMSREGLRETRNDLSGTRVAIYFGPGMDEHSALAMGRAFQWMGCHVDILNADGVKGGSLNSYDVLAIPGGESRPNPWEELGLEGKSRIQKFIGDGGGYIGICLGALYACDICYFWGVNWARDELYLDLFPGTAHCGQEDVAPQGGWPLMTWLNKSDGSHPIIGAMPDRIRIVYYPSSPYLQPYKDTNVTIVSIYEITGNPAMVAFEYGKGRVLLCGPHPEIEVDDDRDGSNRFDDLDDEGSEWPFLLESIKWLAGR